MSPQPSVVRRIDPVTGEVIERILPPAQGLDRASPPELEAHHPLVRLVQGPEALMTMRRIGWMLLGLTLIAGEAQAYTTYYYSRPYGRTDYPLYSGGYGYMTGATPGTRTVPTPSAA